MLLLSVSAIFIAEDKSGSVLERNWSNYLGGRGKLS